MDRGGLSGDDGPTHHGLFDIGYLRHVPGIVHMQPKDEDEFVDMLWTMAHYDDGPIAIRYPRGAGTGAVPKDEPQLLEIGKAEVVADGTDVALIGLGTLFEMAEEARDAPGGARATPSPSSTRASSSRSTPHAIKKLRPRLPRSSAPSRTTSCHNGFGCAVIEAPPRRRHPHPGRPHRLARRVHRARQSRILRAKHGITAPAAVKKVLAELAHEPAVSKATPAA